MTPRSAWAWGAIALAACGRGTDGNRAIEGAQTVASSGSQILRVAYEREIDVLNPLTSQNLADIGFSMIEGLVTTDDSSRYIPVLATTIPTTENGLVTKTTNRVEITWPLRHGVRWHDGQPFTSKDVCFTWKFIVDPRSETYNREQYLGIKECRTPNDSTVVFAWDREYAYHTGLFEAILPEHVLGKLTAEQIVNYEPYNRGSQTIGTGPFKFAEWKAGEYIRVVKNPDYWRGADFPKFDQIVWVFIPDANTRLNALKAGQYDYGRILPTQVRELADQLGYQTHLINSNSVLHLDLSIRTEHGKTLFTEPGVRRALFQAIDRKAIADQLMEGTVRLANSPLNPANPFYHAGLEGYRFDPDAAKHALDSAGWAPGPDGVRVKNGVRFSFPLLNRAGATDRIAVAQVIQAELKAIGVEATFETLESAAWTSRWRRGEWEAIVSGWFLAADPSLTNIYACHGANNMTGLCDPELDRLLDQSDHTLDAAARKALLYQIQERLIGTARTFPIYYNVVPEVVADRIGNYRGSGTNFGSFWNVYQWTTGR